MNNPVCAWCIIGADIAAVDPSGRTPLHLASKEGHIKVVAMLLNKGNLYILKHACYLLFVVIHMFSAHLLFEVIYLLSST